MPRYIPVIKERIVFCVNEDIGDEEIDLKITDIHRHSSGRIIIMLDRKEN